MFLALVAVAAREQDVEDDRVVRDLGGEPEPFVAGERHVDREAVRLEPAFQRKGQPLLVFDDEDPHSTNLPADR